jgi:predicted dehydrogenase
MKKITIGMVGLGQFAPEMMPLFLAHPGVSEVYACDVVPERVVTAQRDFGITRAFGSYEELLASDVDAVALYTQRWMHGPMAIAALKAGKHVYSSVPMASTIDEVEEILDLVRRTGLTYMTGETTYYYPGVVFSRQKWQSGEFGDFVYGEAEYLHDMSHGFYEAYRYSGGSEWKRTASFPPMLYPTHSLGSILGVTGSYATTVSCVGFVDRENDGVFDESVSEWGNTFSNETALFTTADGGSMRINEMRRIGVPTNIPSSRMSMFGTKGSFEQHTGNAVWQTLDGYEDVTGLLRTRPTAPPAGSRSTAGADVVDEALRAEFRSGLSAVHDQSALPASFEGLPNGHEGSHQFLVNDFITAATTQTLPPCNAWASARFIVPGLIAHQSARNGGARLDIPDFGDPT